MARRQSVIIKTKQHTSYAIVTQTSCFQKVKKNTCKYGGKHQLLEFKKKKTNTSYYKRKNDDANPLYKALRHGKDLWKIKENIDKENDSLEKCQEEHENKEWQTWKKYNWNEKLLERFKEFESQRYDIKMIVQEDSSYFCTV